MARITTSEPKMLRRTPSQRRSRERVERILKSASDIIADKGSDALKMSEVAERAKISIGSLYQYFPDKSAIIRTLAEHYNAQCHAFIEEGLAKVRTMEELCEAFGRMFEAYYAFFLAEPVIRDIRTGIQADKTLRDIELEESRANGLLLAEAVLRVRPDADAQSLATATFFIMDIGESTMRLAISVPRAEGDAIVEGLQAHGPDRAPPLLAWPIDQRHNRMPPLP